MVKQAEIPAKWRRLFGLLPNYDPIVSAGDGFWFDVEAAELACDFFPDCLTHVEGEWAGSPFELQDWEKAFVGCLFGWKNAAGMRRYRTGYLEIPKKNGKTTLGAGLGAKLTFADGEPGAKAFSVAADRDQAAIMFDIAKRMVESDEDLAQMSEVYRRSIVVAETGSTWRVMSADAPTKHGINASGVLFDELHAQPNRMLYDTLRGAGSARRQPLHLYFTTAGYDRHSICYEVHTYAEKVAAGIVDDPTFLPVTYTVDEKDLEKWDDPDTWAKANPGLGVSVKQEALEAECREAKESPALENTFKRLHLNIWTEQAQRWLQMAVWDENPSDFDEKQAFGRSCWAGLDLASTTDIAALVLVFKGNQGFQLLSRFWMPEENVRTASQRDKVPYDTWVNQGLMAATQGNVVDYDVIRRDINDLGKQYRIEEIAIDRWNATQIATQLDGDGFTVAMFGQGFASMSAPSKEFERVLLERSLNHGGNPVLRWMASNVARKDDAAGNIKPDKSTSTGRIDGIVAAIMGIGRASVNEGGSVYDTRGLLSV